MFPASNQRRPVNIVFLYGLCPSQTLQPQIVPETIQVNNRTRDTMQGSDLLQSPPLLYVSFLRV